MRALVISDTHFGAWTGEDILRERDTLALLEPQLDVDEVIFLATCSTSCSPRCETRSTRRTGYLACCGRN